MWPNPHSSYPQLPRRQEGSPAYLYRTQSGWPRHRIRETWPRFLSRSPLLTLCLTGLVMGRLWNRIQIFHPLYRWLNLPWLSLHGFTNATSCSNSCLRPVSCRITNRNYRKNLLRKWRPFPEANCVLQLETENFSTCVLFPRDTQYRLWEEDRNTLDVCRKGTLPENIWIIPLKGL
jgi:hypothetical protein